jgi:hypothetical protein
MAPPKRLKISVDGFAVSAALLPQFTPETVEQVVCKSCSPKKTELTEVCSLIQLGFDRDRCFTVMECRKCHQFWAVPYFVEHGPEGVV